MNWVSMEPRQSSCATSMVGQANEACAVLASHVVSLICAKGSVPVTRSVSARDPEHPRRCHSVCACTWVQWQSVAPSLLHASPVYVHCAHGKRYVWPHSRSPLVLSRTHVLCRGVYPWACCHGRGEGACRNLCLAALLSAGPSAH